MKVPFSPPRIDQKILDEVNDALMSGWITTGPRTKKFEKEIALYCQVPNVVAVNSATAGMEVMLRWFGVGPGDEVILPAYTYCSTANVVMHCGATPVMVDTNKDDFNISVSDLAKKISHKTKVIMPVDVSGWPCDYQSIQKVIQDKKALFQSNSQNQKELGRVLLLADAAHSFGAKYYGKPAAAWADVAVFSFHAVKNLTTAEGGAICLNLPGKFDNESIYKELCIKILHGQSKDALAKTKKGAWRYDVVEAGYKCNMTDIQAAIGLVELERYESENLVKRRTIFKKYTEFFKTKDWAIIPQYKNENVESSYHLFLLKIKDASEEQRDAMIQEVFEHDVAVNVHFQPLPLLSFYKGLGYKMEDYPKTWENYKSEITLPVYFNLTDDQIEMVLHAVEDAYQKVFKN